MANYIIDGTLLTNIAAAIRSKKGGSNTYTPAQMATAISGLTPKLDLTTEHHASVPGAQGETISANEQTSFESPVDLSTVAVVRVVVTTYNSALAYVTRIDTATNRIRIKAGPESVRLLDMGIDYYKLKII